MAARSMTPRGSDSIMRSRRSFGGIVHSYQRYDPARIPPPRPPATDLATPAMEHMLATGSLDDLTDEQLAEAVVLDPEQIRGLGPSLDALKAKLEERKRKILETYEAEGVRRQARKEYHAAATGVRPPRRLAEAFQEAVQSEQIRRLERQKRRLRQNIFDVEDEISEKRDRLIDALEKRMQQKTESQPLFTIQWQVI